MSDLRYLITGAHLTPAETTIEYFDTESKTTGKVGFYSSVLLVGDDWIPLNEALNRIIKKVIAAQGDRQAVQPIGEPYPVALVTSAGIQVGDSND